MLSSAKDGQASSLPRRRVAYTDLERQLTGTLKALTIKRRRGPRGWSRLGEIRRGLRGPQPSDRTIRRTLATLVRYGAVKTRGRGPGTGYRLTDTELRSTPGSGRAWHDLSRRLSRSRGPGVQQLGWLPVRARPAEVQEPILELLMLFLCDPGFNRLDPRKLDARAIVIMFRKLVPPHLRAAWDSAPAQTRSDVMNKWLGRFHQWLWLQHCRVYRRGRDPRGRFMTLPSQQGPAVVPFSDFMRAGAERDSGWGTVVWCTCQRPLRGAEPLRGRCSGCGTRLDGVLVDRRVLSPEITPEICGPHRLDSGETVELVYMEPDLAMIDVALDLARDSSRTA